MLWMSGASGERWHIVMDDIDPRRALCGFSADRSRGVMDKEPDWDADVPSPPKLCSDCKKRRLT